jgi:uncharacterized protein YhaN
MRFERLEILRFGKFTDLQLDFPAGGLDFHLIIGPNEAGKSTVRAAIADLLFGIEARTRYAFVHEYDELRLGAAVAAGDLREEFHRLKRMRSALRDVDDNPLKDDLLRPYLGEMDRLSYERMFCLDHQRLVRGGDEILTAKDDLARLLFETSSGITSFGRLRDALEAEAGSLWDKRKSGNRAFYRAQDEFQDAERAVKEATVRARDWGDIERRALDAREALHSANRRHEELMSRRGQLERVRRVAPHLQSFHASMQDRALLADAVRLPTSARDELARAESDIAAADVLLTHNEQRMQEARRRIEEIRVDEACIAHAEEVEALRELRAQTHRHALDIEKRRAELHSKLEEARQIGHQLGWQGDEEALEGMLPSQTVRAAIQGLLEEHGRLAEAIASCEQALAEKQSEIRALSARLEEFTVEAIPPRLAAALGAAQRLGDPDRRIQETREQVRSVQGRLERALGQLRPWHGSIDELRALAVMSDLDARECQTRERELGARMQSRRDELRQLQAEMATQQLKADQLQRSKQPITQQEIRQARELRDELWQQIRARKHPIESAAADFETRVEHADRLADLRYGGASDVALLEHTKEALAQTRLKRSHHEQSIAELAGEIEGLRSGWAQAMLAAGLTDTTPAQFLDWAQRRRDCLKLSETLAELDASLAALLDSQQRVAAELRASLVAAKVGPAAEEVLGFPALVGHAAQAARNIEARQARRMTLLEQQQNAATALTALQTRTDRARAEMSRWESAWVEHAAEARLPARTARSAASQALELFRGLAERLKEIRDLRLNRIEAMQRDLEAFAASAERLAKQIAADLKHEPPESIALELERRLAAAREAAGRLRDTRREIERCQAEIERASSERRNAVARIRPLMEQAGVQSTAELRGAIERSERSRALETAIDEARRACFESGDGLSIERLEAELAAADVAALPGQLSQLNGDLGRATEERDGLLRTAAEAETELRRFAGQPDAAAAEARRQEALAAMSTAIERYIKVLVAARLLRWAIDRYRQDKQGPLLRRAGEVFAILTRGSFERLIVDFEDKTPQLKGCRRGGKLVDVAGMSDGTRDQLYLSLRLAALELQLDQGRALPFVADDLFINFDDERSAAGFQALAELATHTQVIFLTHHEHLLPIVEAALGKPINVVRLQS